MDIGAGSFVWWWDVGVVVEWMDWEVEESGCWGSW